MSADPQTRPPPDAPPAWSVLDLLIALGRHRRLLVLLPLAAAVVAAAVSFALPSSWAATTRILPPQQAQSTAAAVLSQLGGGFATLGGNALGLKNPSDLYIGMLRSDTIADALIARHDLKARYAKAYLVDARKRLQRDTRFAADKAGIIAVTVEASDPRLAADLANGYVEELHRLTGTLAVTEAAQRRLFFERQVAETKEKLADSEVNLRRAIGSGGLVSVDVQGRAAVETGARLRAMISAKEVQIGAMRAYATPQNPEMRRAEQEISSLRRELARLESGVPGLEAGAVDDVSERGVGNIRLLREVKYHEAMFELLAKQYEIARADESKDAPVVQVLDPALPPERKAGPRRLSIVVGAALAGLIVAAAAALVREALAAAARDPGQASRLDALRVSWGRSREARPPS